MCFGFGVLDVRGIGISIFRQVSVREGEMKNESIMYDADHDE